MSYPTNRPALIQASAGAYNVGDICRVVTEVPGFAVWSASSHPNLHHYGKGGLAEHTYEVLSLCVSNRLRCGPTDWADERLSKALVCAAIWHDFGKLWDYKPVLKDGVATTDNSLLGIASLDESYVTWESTPHKRQIHHIARSAIEWTRAVDRFPVHRDIEDDVLHAILSHHGQRQWGSPVEPRSRIAWILHLSDQMSARLNDCDTLHLPFDKPPTHA